MTDTTPSRRCLLAPSTAALVLGCILLGHPSLASTPIGLWYAEGGAAQMEITPCGEELCGRVVWLRSPFDEDGCDQRDRFNPDPSLRDRPLVGLQILSGLAATDDRTWNGGAIHDLSRGSTYRCTLQLDGENRPTPVPQSAPNPARSGEVVTLDGTASSGAFDAVRWTQFAGPRVTITDSESIVASFVAPPVAAPTVVTIVLGLFSPCTPTVLVANVDVMIVPPQGVASIAVEATSVAPGEPGTLDVRFYTDVPVARVEHDLTLAPSIPIAATPDGHPQCAVAPELGPTEAQFEFTPPGCSADVCTGVHIAIASPGAIPDGALLYGCTVAAAAASPSSCDYPYDCCDHPLACDAASAADENGTPVPAQCVEGIVRIQYPQPTAEFVFTVDPLEPRVGDLVHVTVDTVSGFPGLIGIPIYSLSGTQPFFAGDISPRHSTGPIQVTYDLQAVRAGTAKLSIGMTFEGKYGCPGNDFYGFAGLGSEIFPVTIAPAACAGDCDADGRVTIDELIAGVRIALGDAPLTACPAMDADQSGSIRIDDLLAAVTAILRGCTG